MGVLAVGFDRWAGRWAGPAGGGNHSTELVGEDQPVRVVGVAGDPEFASMVTRVIGTTHHRQIVGVGRPAVSPVHDVMNIEPADVRATGHAAATIASFDDPSSPLRNRSSCSTDGERNAIPFPDRLNDSVAADQVEQAWRNSVTVRERCRLAIEMQVDSNRLRRSGDVIVSSDR